MVFVYGGIPLVFSNASSVATTYARNKANGSAMMNFLNMGTCVVILSVLESLAFHRAFLMPLVFMIVCVAMVLLKKRLAHL
jgi:MFS transporter, DHA1 family, multidrug resistance protein